MILMNDFKAEPQELRDDMLSAVSRVFESGWYVLGNEVEQFEKEWAKVCNVKHAIGVANGMDALEIILRAMDVGPGDEVITTSMTAFATVLAIMRSGATPVLADIDPDTGLLSLKSVERSITQKTKAVILVHLYGQIRHITSWKNLCANNNLFLIEDCAQAHLAKSDKGTAGSFGKAGAYSFYPTKNLGAVGDAGALVTNDQEIAEKAKKLRNYGQSVRYEHPLIGLNSRLDEIQAALLFERLKNLEQNTKRRQEIAQYYMKGIQNPLIKLLSAPENIKSHVYHLFVVKCHQRNHLKDYLHSNGVQTNIHYPIPIHLQQSCANIKCDGNGLKSVEDYALQCLSIPCHPTLTDDNINRIVDLINNFEI